MVISRLHKGTINCAIPPVATTVTGLPSSASMRSTMPSSMAAAPYIMPLRIHSMVFFPMARLGRSSWIPGSCAARLDRASADTRTPGMMAPPM